MNDKLHAPGLQALTETTESVSKSAPASDTADEKHKIRLFHDDWGLLLRIDLLFIAAPLATAALILTRLDICTAQSSTWLGPYCDRPLRAIFAGYIMAAIVSIFIGAIRDFKRRDTWKLLSEDVLVYR